MQEIRREVTEWLCFAAPQTWIVKVKEGEVPRGQLSFEQDVLTSRPPVKILGFPGVPFDVSLFLVLTFFFLNFSVNGSARLGFPTVFLGQDGAWNLGVQEIV